MKTEKNKSVIADDVLPDLMENMPLKMLREHPDNPRKTFLPSELEEMAASMRVSGVDQRLLVRPMDRNGKPLPISACVKETGLAGIQYFQIIEGHKRFRAAKLAGLKEVPVDVIHRDDAANRTKCPSCSKLLKGKAGTA